MASDTLNSEATPYVIITGKKAAGLDPETGKILWELELPGTPLRFALDGDRILCALTGAVCAISMDGDLLWHNELRGFGNGHVLLAVPGVTKQGAL